MWSLYSDRNLGVAIKSTIGNFCKSMASCDDTVHFGKITYGEKMINEDNSFVPFINKRIYFKDENEIRAIIKRYYEPNNLNFHGFPVKIDLKTLIEEIYVKPGTKTYVINCLHDIVNKYKINKNVRRSKIDEELPLEYYDSSSYSFHC